MKLRQLLAELSQLDPELEAVISRDGEGNGYSPVDGVDVGQYLPESAHAGERVDGDNDDEETDPDIDTEAQPSKAIGAVFLYPAN